MKSAFWEFGKRRTNKEFEAFALGRCCPSQNPRANAAVRPEGLPLGPPLNIRQVAKLIGLSPWTVRMRLIPMGLPHFRSGANGKLLFYTSQVFRWIEKQQGGNQR